MRLSLIRLGAGKLFPRCPQIDAQVRGSAVTGREIVSGIRLVAAPQQQLPAASRVLTGPTAVGKRSATNEETSMIKYGLAHGLSLAAVALMLAGAPAIAAETAAPAAAGPNDDLYAVLWDETAVEAKAAAIGEYQLAQLR